MTNPVVKSKFRHEAEVSYDFQRRVGEVEEEVTFDSKYRVKLTADTLTVRRCRMPCFWDMLQGLQIGPGMDDRPLLVASRLLV